MRANLNYAQVYNGIVEAVCVGDNWEDVNAVARCAFGEEAFAVDVTYCHVRRGDLYHDGSFWRVDEETGEETMIPFEATEAEEIETLKKENTDLKTQNAALQEDLTNTQLATVEVYEMLLATTEGGTE